MSSSSSVGPWATNFGDLLDIRPRNIRPRNIPASLSSSMDSGPPAPVAMDVDTEVVIIEGMKAVIECTEGCIVKTVSYEVNNILPNDSVWHSGTEAFQCELLSISRDIAKNKIWLVARLDIDSNPGLTIDSVAKVLFAGAPEIGAVVEYETNAFKLVVRKRRNNMSMFGDVCAIDFFSMTPADHHLKMLQPSNTFLFLKAVLNSNRRVVCNYAVKMSGVAAATDSLIERQAVEYLKGLSVMEREIAIATSKNKSKSDKSAMDHCLAVSHVQIVNAVLADEQSTVVEDTLMRMANDKDIKVWQSFELARKQMAWTFDVLTGEDVEFSLLEFVEQGWYRQYTLFLIGDPCYGKTVAAESICAELCKAQRPRRGGNKFFFKLGTVDLLRKVQHLIIPKTPLLFDDVTVSKLWGSREPMEMDMCKHLTNAQFAEGVDMRCGDVVLPKKRPRIFTSNACSALEWCNEVIDVRAVFPVADRLTRCSADGLAMYKRCAFAQVVSPFISPADAAAFLAAMRADGARDLEMASDSDSL